MALYSARNEFMNKAKGTAMENKIMSVNAEVDGSKIFPMWAVVKLPKKTMSEAASCAWTHCKEVMLESSRHRASASSWMDHSKEYDVFGSCGHFMTEHSNGVEKIKFQVQKHCCGYIKPVITCLLDKCPDYVDDGSKFRLFSSSGTEISGEKQFFGLTKHIAGVEEPCEVNLLARQNQTVYYLGGTQKLQLDQYAFTLGPAFDRPSLYDFSESVALPWGVQKNREKCPKQATVDHDLYRYEVRKYFVELLTSAGVDLRAHAGKVGDEYSVDVFLAGGDLSQTEMDTQFGPNDKPCEDSIWWTPQRGVKKNFWLHAPYQIGPFWNIMDAMAFRSHLLGRIPSFLQQGFVGDVDLPKQSDRSFFVLDVQQGTNVGFRTASEMAAERMSCGARKCILRRPGDSAGLANKWYKADLAEYRDNCFTGNDKTFVAGTSPFPNNQAMFAASCCKRPVGLDVLKYGYCMSRACGLGLAASM